MFTVFTCVESYKNVSMFSLHAFFYTVMLQISVCILLFKKSSIAFFRFIHVAICTSILLLLNAA